MARESWQWANEVVGKCLLRIASYRGPRCCKRTLFLAVQEEFGSFRDYTLSFFPGGKPITNHFRSLNEIPASSPESDAMSRDMKKRGFKFFGPTICYAHLQASGFVNDHLTGCICRNGQ